MLWYQQIILAALAVLGGIAGLFVDFFGALLGIGQGAVVAMLRVLMIVAILVTLPGCKVSTRGTTEYYLDWGTRIAVGQDTKRNQDGVDEAIAEFGSQPLDQYLTHRWATSQPCDTNGVQ